MSDPKLISPLLDNFAMGDPITDHDGVRCCPAIKNETDEKFIVKIVSVPATAVQLDALLLSGAYSDKEAALAYYKTLAEDITNEAEVLNKLAQVEGFAQIDGFQIEAKDDGNGYDVYLLSRYQNTLRHLIRRNSVTHLHAVNLGLDLCAALSVSRRMGYMYVNLKPGNIYITENQGFVIGDIGFIKLKNLNYASLPDRYHSEYTAPEISDAYSSLNTTLDTYAVGMLLYKIFNDNKLPDHAEDLEAPAYADSEMAEIILKACAKKPEERWQDPVELGNALVGYMQRNGAHDTPIVPTEEATTGADETIEGRYEETANTAETIEQEDPEAAEVSAEPEPDEIEITEESIYTEDNEGNLTLIDEPESAQVQAENAEEVEYEELSDEASDMLLHVDELIAHEAPSPVVQPEPIDVPVPPVVIDEEPDEIKETVQEEEETDPDNTEQEVAAQATSDLVEAPLEEPLAEDVEPTGEITEEDIQPDELDLPLEESSQQEPSPKKEKKKAVGWVILIISLLLLGAAVLAGIWGYNNYYLQTIDDIVLSPNEGGILFVKVVTKTNYDDLVVYCTDTYGNQKSGKPVNGSIRFSELTPDTAYNIRVEIKGFHKLTGKTTTSYATPKRVNITSFTADNGVHDGDVNLAFTYEGPKTDKWSITYQTEGDTPHKVLTSGKQEITLPALEVGKEYTFTLTSEADIEVAGATTVKYTPKAVIKAEELTITQCVDNVIHVEWSVKDNLPVNSWSIYCYNNEFTSESTVKECAADITIPDMALDYVIEVTADGMKVGSTVTLAKKSTTITKTEVNTDDPTKLIVSWENGGYPPEGGWILKYSVNGAEPVELAVTEGSTTSISPRIPDSEYDFTIMTDKGVQSMKGTFSCKTPAAPNFSKYGVTHNDMLFIMGTSQEIDDVLAPQEGSSEDSDEDTSDDESNTDEPEVSYPEEHINTAFSADDEVAFLIRLDVEREMSTDDILALFIIRDESGNIIYTPTWSTTWDAMWNENGVSKLNVPGIPQEPGSYTVSIYFNGTFVNTTAFSIQ